MNTDSIEKPSLKKNAFRFLMLTCYTLVFSYYPVVTLGSIAGVHIDISLLYIVVLLSVVVSLPLIITHLAELWRHTPWKILVAFSLFTSASILWSPNTFRAVFTAGFLWLLVGLVSVVYIHLPQLVKQQKSLIKIVAVAIVLLEAWAAWQIIGDALGVSSVNTLLGQNYSGDVFGFARPTGFALEPQFFGSLLIAPICWLVYSYLKKDASTWVLLAIVVSISLLIFSLSRGALLATIVAVTVVAISTKAPKKRFIQFGALAISSVVVSFLAIYGIASLRQSDSISGYGAVRGSVSQLSLGAIHLPSQEQPTKYHSTSSKTKKSEYVASSTASRLSMSEQAIQLWSKNPQTILFGVGIGGFGASLAGDMKSAVVNNYYIETLTETGIVGFTLFISFIGSIVYWLVRKKQWLLLAIIFGYLIQFYFYSGNANSIHVWLVLGLAMAVTSKIKLLTTSAVKHDSSGTIS